TVDDDVVALEEPHRVMTCQPRLVRFDLDVRIDVAQTVARGFNLSAAEIFGSVNDLALQIRFFHDIEIDDANPSHTSGCEVHSHRRAESTRSNHQHTRRFQFSLPLHADFRHD